MGVNNTGDELYAIEEVKKLRTTDPSSAKSWIITAKSLFPNNFNIQVSIMQESIYFTKFF